MMAAVGLPGLVAIGSVLATFSDHAGSAYSFAHAEWLFAAVAAFGIATGLAGLRFRCLVPAADTHWLPSRHVLFRLFFAANALNIVFPGPAGDLALAAYLQRKYQLPTATGIATALHARLVGLWATGGLAIGFAIGLPLPEELASGVAAGIAVVGVLGLGAATAAAHPTWLRCLSGSLSRFRYWPHKRLLPLLTALHAVHLEGWRPRWMALAWSLVIQGFVFLSLACVVASSNLSISIVSLLLTHATSGVAAVGAVLLPAGGAGAFEASFAATLSSTSSLTLAQSGLLLTLVRLVHLLTIGLSSVVLMVSTAELTREPTLERAVP